ncbi:MAG TPA: helix-turn-helix domain-containing protein [Polyangiaceae bacterium]|nr:helix-turn-helix domain-containing protein [Polyangiaceae bacterium]
MNRERDTITVAFVAVVREAVRSELAEFHPAQPKPSLLDAEALAHELGVSVPTVRRLAKRGAIPFVLVGESLRYELARVLAQLRADAEAKDCAPKHVVDAADHRERCAGCGAPYEPHVKCVVRMLGSGDSYHLACAPNADDSSEAGEDKRPLRAVRG